MTLRPGKKNLRILRGDPLSFALAAQLDGSDEVVAQGQPLCQVRKPDDTLLASFTVTVSNAGKTATCAMSAATTASLPVGLWIWDFQASSTSDTWVGGTFQVDQDASHP